MSSNGWPELTGRFGAIWYPTRCWQRWPVPTLAASPPLIAGSPGFPESAASTPPC